MTSLMVPSPPATITTSSPRATAWRASAVAAAGPAVASARRAQPRADSAARHVDGLAPLGAQEQALARTCAGHARARRDLLDNGQAIFQPWILVGEDHQLAALGGDAAHLRTLAAIALARRAENGDEAAGR